MFPNDTTEIKFNEYWAINPIKALKITGVFSIPRSNSYQLRLDGDQTLVVNDQASELHITLKYGNHTAVGRYLIENENGHMSIITEKDFDDKYSLVE